MTADEIYATLNWHNSMQPIHMQRSLKQKTFCEIFFQFLKSILNLEHFVKKDDPHSWCISQIRDSEKRG